MEKPTPKVPEVAKTIKAPKPSPIKLSKNRLKKLAKQKVWESRKEELVAKRKQKRKAKKIRKRIAKKEAKLAAEKNPELIIEKPYVPSKRFKKKLAKAKIPEAPLLIIDSSFEKVVDPSTLKSLTSQYSHINAIMRDHEKIFRVEITGLQEESIKLLKIKHPESWLVRGFTEDYVDVLQNGIRQDMLGMQVLERGCTTQNLADFKTEDLIYLSGDAEEEMGDIDLT